MGIQTIVDFLASKGMEVDAKPNTKIDAEAYALIRSNFQDEKAAKEKAGLLNARSCVLDFLIIVHFKSEVWAHAMLLRGGPL